MEKVLEEEIKEKEALKGYMQSQDNLADELEKQLNGLKLELQTKDDTIVKMGESDKNAINSLNNVCNLFLYYIELCSQTNTRTQGNKLFIITFWWQLTILRNCLYA